ncbi:MAG: outer membrane protein transport protein [Mariprofundaceae bacterium]|nr:outer membrane protein transport protein [Mariprofundaceae bacterium]
MRHLLITVMILLLSSTAFASGFSVKDQGTKAMSLANAFTGVADDTTAAWYNPAALVFQEGLSITGGGQVVIPTVNYTDLNGKAYSMDKKTHIIPFAYVSYKMEDAPVAFGLAVNAPFGLSTDWTNSGAPFSKILNPGVVEKSLTFSEIKMISVNPTVAYQINENFSVAAGVMYFDATNIAFDNAGVSQHGTGNGWGGNAAIFYKSDSFNAGLTYRSRVKVDVSGTATGLAGLTSIGAGALIGKTSTVNTSFTTPDMVSGGISFHPIESVLVSAQVDWVNWKTFDKLVFNYGPSALTTNVIRASSKTVPENWRATTSFALGTEWTFQKDMHLRAGYSFDPSPVNNVDFSPRTADKNRHFFTIGYGQDFSAGTLNLAYGYIFMKNINQTASVAARQRNGTYKGNIHIFAADYTLRF